MPKFIQAQFFFQTWKSAPPNENFEPSTQVFPACYVLPLLTLDLHKLQYVLRQNATVVAHSSELIADLVIGVKQSLPKSSKLEAQKNIISDASSSSVIISTMWIIGGFHRFLTGTFREGRRLPGSSANQ